MPAYVDDARHPYRRMIMCHMVADTLEELHEMADKIGLNRAWYQDHRLPHYDLSITKRAEAISNGAKPITSREAVRISRLCREHECIDACAQGIT